MKNNTDLNEEKLDAFANAAVQYNIEKQLRIRYDKILADKKYNTQKKATVLQMSTLTKIAAVVVGILGCLFLMQLFTDSPSAHQTAQALLDQTHISSNPDITRKGKSTVNQIRREANDAYTLKDYPLAIIKYESLKSQSEITTIDQFYLGISYLKTGNNTEAIALFSDLKANEKIEEIDWLLSLSYVLSREEENAVPLLQKIIAEKKYKYREAKKLLNAIE